VTAAASLTPAFADKLVKVLGMLGSAHDGEVAAAGRRAHSMLKAEGLTWVDVIKPAAPKSEQPQQQSYRPQRRWRSSTSPSDTAALCLLWPEVLTDWETNFCRSIVGRRRISAKQTVVLERLARKVEAFAHATGED
jgi:hypothetical protein